MQPDTPHRADFTAPERRLGAITGAGLHYLLHHNSKSPLAERTTSVAVAIRNAVFLLLGTFAERTPGCTATTRYVQVFDSKSFANAASRAFVPLSIGELRPGLVRSKSI